METVMMQLGEFQFSLSTAVYQEFTRRTEYRWPAQERLGGMAALQFTGPGEDTITLAGTIYPEFRGGIGQLDSMRDMAGDGQPLMMINGLGEILGSWVIESVDERASVFAEAGVARKQDFTLKLRRYGDAGDDDLANAQKAAASIQEANTRPQPGVVVPGAPTGALAGLGSVGSALAGLSSAVTGAASSAVSNLQAALSGINGVAGSIAGSIAPLAGAINAAISSAQSLNLAGVSVNGVSQLGEASRAVGNVLAGAAGLTTAAMRVASLARGMGLGLPPAAFRALQAVQASGGRIAVASTSLYDKGQAVLVEVEAAEAEAAGVSPGAPAPAPPPPPAEDSATAAANSAAQAALSAAVATSAANDSAISAQAAEGAVGAVVVSATNAANSAAIASAAATTATGAIAAADDAADSAAAAAASAAAASASQGAAATSATTATTQAGNAATSATSASGSATTATTQAGNAATSASAASGSATTATTQAGNAATSATNAANSATTAATQAGNASASATAAATSETNAANSAATATAATASKYDKTGGAISGPAYTPPSNVAFSATPTFNAAASNVFYMGVLTGNVTSFTISNPMDGQTINIRFAEDGTGGRTVTPPANVKADGSITTGAGRVSWLILTYVGSGVNRWEGAWTVVPA